MNTTNTKAGNTTSGRNRIWLKLTASIIFVIVLAVAIAEIMGWPFLRQPLEKFASKQLERQIRLEAPFKLRLLGGIKLEAGGLWIGAPEGFDAPYFLDANNVMLTLRYRDLFKLPETAAYRVQALKVYAIDTRAIRHQDGHSTWQFKQNQDTPSRPFPIIEALVVSNGQALVQDALTRADLKVTFNTEEGAADKEPSSHVDIQGEFRGRPIKGAVNTNGFLPVATQSDDASPLQSKGWVEYGKVRADFDGAISDLFGDQNIKGKLAVKGPSLSMLGDLVDVTLPTTEAFKLRGLIEKKDEVWNSRIDSAQVGNSDMSGDFKYDPRLSPPVLSGNLRGKRFVLADLAPAFGTRNEDGSTTRPKDGRAIPDRPLDLPSLNKMDANIKVNLDYVDLGRAFSQPIAPLKADLAIDQGVLSLSKIDARTAQGSISGLIAVDAHQTSKQEDAIPNEKAPAQAIPQWKIDLAWKDIDLEQWLQVSKDRKDEANKKGKKAPPAYVTGTLNGKTKLTGQGQSTAKLLGSLDGDVSMYIHEGSLSHLIIEVLGLDVAQAIGVLVSGDESLPMECAVMDLKAKDGIITPNVALVDTPVTMILIDGDINMATENLNLRLSAKPKNFSPLTLRSPIRVTGPFTSPKASPEGGPIAAKVLGSLALAFLNPLAAILPLIDPGATTPDKAASNCSKSLANLEKTQQLSSAKVRQRNIN